jgi:phosphatidylserine decarboxylase
MHLYFYRFLTYIATFVAPWHGGFCTTWIIRRFVKKYNVNMAEAVNPDITSYRCFNEFFTRPLKPGARSIASAQEVCPVDGKISQLGPIHQDQLIQAKGSHFTATALLGGDAALAKQFANGTFATIYLSPRDYHRIHMPSDGKLVQMTYVPGDLYPVKPAIVNTVPGVFARNERVVCVFESEKGPFIMVLVGAAIVASIETVWHGVVNADHQRKLQQWRYDDQAIHLKKGDEMGRFLLGSTVIMLYPENRCEFTPNWSENTPVVLGEAMSKD